MNRYRKFIVAALGAAVVAVNTFFGAGIGLAEVQDFITVGTALLTALGVERIPNEEA